MEPHTDLDLLDPDPKECRSESKSKEIEQKLK
jgi:hypothetical protein